MHQEPGVEQIRKLEKEIQNEPLNQELSPSRNQKQGQWANMMTTVKLACLKSGAWGHAE